MLLQIIKRSFPIILLAIIIPIAIGLSPIENLVQHKEVLTIIYLLTFLCSFSLVTIAIFEYVSHCYKALAARYADAFDDNTNFILTHTAIPEAFKHQFNEFNTVNIRKVMKDVEEMFPYVYMDDLNE